MSKSLHGFDNNTRRVNPLTLVEVIIILVCAVLIVTMLSCYFLFSKAGSTPKLFGQIVYVTNANNMEPDIPSGSAVFASDENLDLVNAQNGLEPFHGTPEEARTWIGRSTTTTFGEVTVSESMIRLYASSIEDGASKAFARASGRSLAPELRTRETFRMMSLIIESSDSMPLSTKSVVKTMEGVSSFPSRV